MGDGNGEFEIVCELGGELGVGDEAVIGEIIVCERDVFVSGEGVFEMGFPGEIHLLGEGVGAQSLVSVKVVGIGTTPFPVALLVYLVEKMVRDHAVFLQGIGMVFGAEVGDFSDIGMGDGDAFLFGFFSARAENFDPIYFLVVSLEFEVADVDAGGKSQLVVVLSRIRLRKGVGIGFAV